VRLRALAPGNRFGERATVQPARSAARQTGMRPIACLLILTLAACTHDVRVHYPSDPAEETGTVTLVFTKPASDVIVAVNGVLVVSGEDTSRVQIDGIPIGTAELSIAAGPAEKAMRVWVSAENPLSIPLGYPGSTAGDTLKGLLSSVAGILLYALLFR